MPDAQTPPSGSRKPNGAGPLERLARLVIGETKEATAFRAFLVLATALYYDNRQDQRRHVDQLDRNLQQFFQSRERETEAIGERLDLLRTTGEKQVTKLDRLYDAVERNTRAVQGGGKGAGIPGRSLLVGPPNEPAPAPHRAGGDNPTTREGG